jgi:hypothetical protein
MMNLQIGTGMTSSAGNGDRQTGTLHNCKSWIWRNWPPILTACFALVWIIHRAYVQSITLDEANTFLRWVAPNVPAHWEPHSNNHVLNSTLMRLCIWLFGLSQMTVRAPALMGGVVYILAMFRLCSLLASGRVFRWALFVCFVCNPFIMDYLVAARGYGMALGFLGLAIYLFAGMLLEERGGIGERDILKRSAAISACIALSICASYTFAYACSFLLLAAGSLAGVRLVKQKRGISLTLLRLAAACSLPGIIILAVFAGSALTRFPREQLFWGTDSLLESWRDIREASFVELNPHLVNPLLAGFFDVFKRYLFRALAAFGTGYIFLLFVARRELREPHAKSRLLLATSLTAVLTLTVAAHWLQFKLMKIPLPLERTSIFVVPIATALAGASLSVRLPDLVPRFQRMAWAIRTFGIAILLMSGFYFIGEIRDSYFREWREGAEVKAAFPVIVDLCRRDGVREVASDPNLASSLNFYRALHRVNDLEEFRSCETMPADHSVYVVLESRYREFVQTKGLQVAWRGAASDLVVLVRRGSPDAATR